MSDNVDEKILQLKQAIKDASGNITDEIVQLVEEITSNRSSGEVNKLQSLAGKQIDNDFILSSIAQLPQPDILSRSIKNTLSSILNPTKMAFTREIPKYIDAISYDKEVQKTIPRTIPKNSLIDLNPTDTGVEFVKKYPDAPDSERVINPQFKQLLSTGYKPEDAQTYQNIASQIGEDNPFLSVALITPPSGSLELGTPESDYLKNGVGGDQPSYKKEIINTSVQMQAALITDSFKNVLDNVFSSIDNNNFKIRISGKLNSNDRLTKLMPKKLGDMTPSWKINYTENNNKYFLDIKSKIKYSKSSGLLPNSSSIRFSGDIEEFGNQETNKDVNAGETNKEVNAGETNKEVNAGETNSRLSELNIDKDICDLQINDELFSSIMIDKLKGKLESNNRSMNSDEKKELVTYLKSIYSDVLNNFISDIFSSIANNRLLKEYRPSSPPDIFNSSEDKEKNKLTLLGLINFVPETPEDLAKCGKSLHPLNTDEILDLMSKKFNSIGLQKTPPEDTEEEAENPVSESVKLGGILAIMRLFAFEYLIRNLIVFDELGYNKSLVNNVIIKEYLSIMTKKELQDLNMYNSIELTIVKNYEFLKKEKIILPEDETQGNVTTNAAFDGNIFQTPNQKFKNLLAAMLRKSVGYVRNLLGVKSEETRTEADILSNRKVYDIFAIKNTELNTLLYNLFNTTQKQRFSELPKNKNSFIVLEKYLKASTFRQDLFKDQQSNIACNNKLRDVGGMGATSFDEYSSFIYEFITNPSKHLEEQFINDNIKNNLNQINIQNISTFFTVPLKIGIRLSFIKKQDQYVFTNTKDINDASSAQMQNLGTFYENRYQNFYINENKQRSVKIMKQFIKQERSYAFFESDKQENGDISIVHYNSLPIAEHEIEISFLEILRNLREISQEEILNRINSLYEQKKQELIKELSKKPDYQIVVKKSLSADKIINLLSFYSDRALATEEIENMFRTTKRSIKKMIKYSENIDDYGYVDEDQPPGGDVTAYQRDMNNVGNPMPLNFDILWFLITAPILVLKGLTQIMDPNIAIASQIVNVWDAGLLTPKFDQQGNIVQYPNPPPFPLPTVLPSLALLPPTVFPPPPVGIGIGIPVTPIPGMLYWALEPLLWKFPYYQNMLSKAASEDLQDNPDTRGLSFKTENNFSCNKNQDDV